MYEVYIRVIQRSSLVPLQYEDLPRSPFPRPHRFYVCCCCIYVVASDVPIPNTRCEGPVICHVTPAGGQVLLPDVLLFRNFEERTLDRFAWHTSLNARCTV